MRNMCIEKTTVSVGKRLAALPNEIVCTDKSGRWWPDTRQYFLVLFIPCISFPVRMSLTPHYRHFVVLVMNTAETTGR